MGIGFATVEYPGFSNSQPRCYVTSITKSELLVHMQTTELYILGSSCITVVALLASSFATGVERMAKNSRGTVENVMWVKCVHYCGNCMDGHNTELNGRPTYKTRAVAIKDDPEINT